MIVNREKDKFQILNFQLNIERVEKISQEFSVRDFSPILIKGLAAALNYPKPYQRIFTDIDLAVDPACFKRASKICKENNFNVDLHRGLRHLDVLGWDDLFRNSRFIKIGNTNIRVLRPEDHLRVLCVHWLNDGGADRTRLWDIYFALQNKSEDFDWERFTGGVGEKRKKWLMTAVLLAKDYFALNLKDLPAEFEQYRIPQWVKAEVEREWQSEYRLVPLQQAVRDKKMFIRQVFKRLPPNALQALVENDEDIFEKLKYSSLLINFLKRMKPSVKRFLEIDSEN